MVSLIGPNHIVDIILVVISQVEQLPDDQTIENSVSGNNPESTSLRMAYKGPLVVRVNFYNVEGESLEPPVIDAPFGVSWIVRECQRLDYDDLSVDISLSAGVDDSD